MKRILLAIGVLVTLCNMTIGVAYSAKCQSTSGARACGTTCAALSGGECGCQGTCTAEETKWVEGAKGGDDEELLME